MQSTPTRYDGPTYYGQSPLKPSFWGETVAGYLFVGGLSGAAQVIASVAEAAGTGGRIVRNGRLIAVGGIALGSVLLVADLRTPQRFYNMLRIWRATSPMSIGSWVLGAFTVASAAPAAAALVAPPHAPRIRALARVSRWPVAASGAVMSVYTASLLAATSTPAWAVAPRLLAVRFGSAAIATAAAALSLAERVDGDPALCQPLDRLAALGVLVEAGAGVARDARVRRAGVRAPEREARIRILRRLAFAVGTVLPLACHALNELRPRRSRTLSALAAAGTLVGGYLARSAVLREGNASAADARDAFSVAQRERPERPERLDRFDRFGRLDRFDRPAGTR